MKNDVELLVDGTRYGGWTRATVKRSIDTVSASFRLELTEHDPETGEPWRFDPSDRCEVTVAGETLVNGYIDAVEGMISSDAHSLSITGRDRTADLIDSSAEVDPGEWSDVTLTQLARKLVAPYDLDVTARVDAGEPFSVFKVEPSESAFEALERAARQRGVLLNADRDGDLVITRPGNQRATDALVQGENVLEARAGASHEERFSRYVCLGQRPGDDNITGEQTTGIRGEARDRAADDRNRVLVVIAEQAASPASAKQRAEWEAATRAARSATLEVTVQGWRQSDGALWREGLTVPVRLPKLRVEGDLIVAQATFRLDDRGRRTQLSLARPDAYAPKPVIDNDDEADLYGAAQAGEYETNWGRSRD